MSGRSRTVMVVGEPGIGKTRMVEELSVYTFARCRGARGCGVIRTRERSACRSSPSSRRCARWFAMATGSAPIRRPVALNWRRSCPSCAKGSQLPVLPPLEGDADGTACSRGSARSSKPSPTGRPVVRVLDDLHWADKPSLLLLAHLCRRVRGASRLMLVGTYRDVELERSHPLAEMIGTLRRERLYERVLVARTADLDEVKDFIEAVGGRNTHVRSPRLIFRETEGNPFFVAEILRHLVESGALRHEGGGWVGRAGERGREPARGRPRGHRPASRRAWGEGCNAAPPVAAAMPGGFTIDVVGDVAGVDEDSDARLPRRGARRPGGARAPAAGRASTSSTTRSSARRCTAS